MPTTTHELKDLLTAFSKAQAEIGKVKTDTTNPQFRSLYASLEAVQDAAFPILRANGLVTVQGAYSTVDDQSRILVTGTLALWHIESGQHIDMQLTMIPKDSGPQAIGSVVSYLRRYLLVTTLGLGTTDDDGEAASKPKAPPKQQYQPQAAAKPATKPTPVDGKPWMNWQSSADAANWAVSTPAYEDVDEALRIFKTVYKVRVKDPKNPTAEEKAIAFEAFYTNVMEELDK